MDHAEPESLVPSEVTFAQCQQNKCSRIFPQMVIIRARLIVKADPSLTRQMASCRAEMIVQC